MGKLILITGGNGSGKSRFAEQLIAQTTGARYYIATMEPHTEENYRRIRKHIAQRADLGCTTLELPTRVGDAPVTADSVVLLEDVSNLLSNAMFTQNASMEAVWEDILELKDRCKLLVAVSIGGLCPSRFTGETAQYIISLNQINRQLQERSLAAAVMADGNPVWEKGSIHDIL